jgi:hypothetical protein
MSRANYVQYAASNGSGPVVASRPHRIRLGVADIATGCIGFACRRERALSSELSRAHFQRFTSPRRKKATSSCWARRLHAFDGLHKSVYGSLPRGTPTSKRAANAARIRRHVACQGTLAAPNDYDLIANDAGTPSRAAQPSSTIQGRRPCITL